MKNRYLEVGELLAARIVSSVILLPILILLIVIGGIPLQISLMILSSIGLYEIYKTLSGKIIRIHYIGFGFCVLYYALISVVNSTLTLFLYTLFMISVLIFLVVNHSSVSIADCAYTFFGSFYVVFLLSFVYWVRDYDYGRFSVWLIFISAWGCDTGAYFVGKSLGRHKLTPVLSKNKTIEGAVGGVFTATLLAFVYGWIVSGFLSFEEINTIMFSTIVGCAGSIFAQFGDLTASAIKRKTGIKDFGSLIPGHGGIIDRFDSILFTAPIVFFVMYLLLRFGTG